MIESICNDILKHFLEKEKNTPNTIFYYYSGDGHVFNNFITDDFDKLKDENKIVIKSNFNNDLDALFIICFIFEIKFTNDKSNFSDRERFLNILHKANITIPIEDKALLFSYTDIHIWIRYLQRILNLSTFYFYESENLLLPKNLGYSYSDEYKNFEQIVYTIEDIINIKIKYKSEYLLK